MRAAGIILIVLGLIGIAFGFSANVAVDAPGVITTDPLLRSGQVANSDLMSQRESTILVGCAAFVSGIVLLAARAVTDAVHRREPPASKV